MTLYEIIKALNALGISVRVQGDTLAFEPKGKLPAALIPEIREHKSALMDLLSPRQVGVITSLDRLREMAARMDKKPVAPFDLSDYGEEGLRL